jgi:hypothetical protein
LKAMQLRFCYGKVRGYCLHHVFWRCLYSCIHLLYYRGQSSQLCSSKSKGDRAQEISFSLTVMQKCHYRTSIPTNPCCFRGIKSKGLS